MRPIVRFQITPSTSEKDGKTTYRMDVVVNNHTRSRQTRLRSRLFRWLDLVLDKEEEQYRELQATLDEVQTGFFEQGLRNGLKYRKALERATQMVSLVELRANGYDLGEPDKEKERSPA